MADTKDNTNQDIGSLFAEFLRTRNSAPVSLVHSADEYDKTGQDTHRATERGYAHGQLIEIGGFVPADTPVSESWMEPLAAKDRKLAKAVQEAQDESPKDVDLTKLSKSALEAMAAERGVNVAGLSKEDLITAIKAEREPTI